MINFFSRRTFVSLMGVSLGAAALAGCSGKTGDEAADDKADSAEADGIDYTVLVNKQNKLPDGWEEAIELEHFTNTAGWDVDVEKKAYAAYLELKADLEADGVYVDLDSAFRPIAEQQRIWDDFTKDYGEEYTKLHVATPGYSEHHTGLALDLYLIIDGEDVYMNEDMVQYPEVWAKIHAKLADHGFILRYLPKKKIETGYSYEPWHIRYLDDPDMAREITDQGITYERYLDALDPMVADCTVDYGTSQVFEETDIDGALDPILAMVSGWEGVTLQRIAFTDDQTCEDNVAYVNELREAQMPDAAEFDQALVLLSDFHTPKEIGELVFEADADYNDYQWILGRTQGEGSWNLMTQGYA
ncbi:D-alanyl-D-alanine carboxypeptidase [Slackia heliotrinireducens]|uniref:D-alanyl-D-alanine carboxypeptidase n=1 Tax=Slackia heliotrinireducens (strain ATCC 29202 / DSM 20476 / NCTC 11029 / RHS 1) TaxID=471855 RepID=C7N7G6_SLAHD|nr:M15 family metallopeptidase [Slackia heliotrinireducens]ACV22851.1 D-alanyl-D-alanine carboxypeptidase [Slackia heliotrinireducens DSM 20476]VEH01604.1 D-alanyl-D-alanine carboxypeptidase [Slackia heliotrinireducens]